MGSSLASSTGLSLQMINSWCWASLHLEQSLCSWYLNSCRGILKCELSSVPPWGTEGGIYPEKLSQPLVFNSPFPGTS